MRARAVIWAAIVAVYLFDVSYYNGIHVGAMEAVGRNVAAVIVTVISR
jgi:hypothetical protein